MKTGEESGLLLYNTGQSSYADYLGIELFEGKIRLLMNKGNGPTELIHGTPVADGKWHRVAVDFNPSGIGITVDRQEKTISLPSGGNRYLDLADTLYIGGTELNKRAKAFGKGLKSGDVSYKGCLRNMMLDNKELGLPDVKISQGIVVGCVWGFPCIEADPCVSGGVCSQLGVSSFKCDCDQLSCINPNHAEDYEVNNNRSLVASNRSMHFLSLEIFYIYNNEISRLPSFRQHFPHIFSHKNFWKDGKIIFIRSFKFRISDLLESKFTRELGNTLIESPTGMRRRTCAADER